jgi:hypothetical protein
MWYNLDEAVSETLHSLIHNENYQLPILLVCIGMTGNLMYFRYIADPANSEVCKCEKLTEHFEEQGLRCPVRLIFLDSGTPRVEMLTIDSFEERAA